MELSGLRCKYGNAGVSRAVHGLAVGQHLGNFEPDGYDFYLYHNLFKAHAGKAGRFRGYLGLWCIYLLRTSDLELFFGIVNPQPNDIS